MESGNSSKATSVMLLVAVIVLLTTLIYINF